MGGDHGCAVVVEGVRRALEADQKISTLFLVGDQAEIESALKMTYDDILRDKVVVGAPDTVAARLSELQEQLGIDGILAELNFGALVPAEQMMRSLQLLCQEVRPRIRPRQAAPTAAAVPR